SSINVRYSDCAIVGLRKIEAHVREQRLIGDIRITGDGLYREMRSDLRKSSRLCTHRYAGRTLQFAPADPAAFDGAQDCFPDAVTEHRPIDQPHWQNAPGAHDRLALQHAS